MSTREETDAEHIARDMKEGRFPERSPRQMVPAEEYEYRGIFHDLGGRTILSNVIDADGNPLRIQGGKTIGEILAAERRQ